MTNIVPFEQSRGFTRMDNQLMDGLMAIDLPGRELKVALYIAKATLNFQAGAVRIKATDVSKATNLHPDVASKAIAHLLKRRVIFREGGSRGDIGLCDPKEWLYYECPSQTNRSDSDHSGKVVSIASQTKTDDSLLYSKKQPPITLPSEEIITPQAENPAPEPAPQPVPEPEKPEPKAAFGKTQMLADNPHNLDESLIADYLAVRKAKKAGISAGIWSRLNRKLESLKAFGVSPSQGLEIAIDKGWQGFEVEWVLNHLKGNAVAPRSNSAGPDFHSGDTSWARDLGPL